MLGNPLVRFCEGQGGNQMMVRVTPSLRAPCLLDHFPLVGFLSARAPRFVLTPHPSRPNRPNLTSGSLKVLVLFPTWDPPKTLGHVLAVLILKVAS
jgi:hypothetical protein